VLDTYVCIAEGEPPGFFAFDAETRLAVDREAAKEEDRAAFRAGSRLHHSLIRHRTELGPDDPVEVAIWFRVDDADLPDETLQRLDAEVDAYVRAVRDDRMRATAIRIAAALNTMDNSEVHANLDAPRVGVPHLLARLPNRHLTAVGELPEVNLVMPAAIDPELVPLSEQYFTSDQAWLHHWAGWTGTGITVAIVENYPDSRWNLPGAPSGGCATSGGSVHCHCPSGSSSWHPRQVAGLIRTGTDVTSFGGIARTATTIFANQHWDCLLHGLDPHASALNWATDQGASVLNFSTSGAEHHHMFWDYKAVRSPWPMVVAGSGNGAAVDPVVGNRLRNGLVVGAGNDVAASTRHDVTMWAGSRWQNPVGWGELPHILAPGHQVATAGFGPGQVDTPSGTSHATPQVAAAAADLQHQNPDLKSLPWLITSGLMVSADINVDGATGGVWPLQLHDAIDDRDGAGLMNMGWAAVVLQASAKYDPAQPPMPSGHDHGAMAAFLTPANTYYDKDWDVHVGSGKRSALISF
jgi:hypothetical protein